MDSKTYKWLGYIFTKVLLRSPNCQIWFPNGGLFVLDDLMTEGSEDKDLLDFFTKLSHHQNITVMFLCQDMFPPGKYAKSISRNVHYIIAFKNPRDHIRNHLKRL